MRIKKMYKELEDLGGFTTNVKELNQEQLDFLEENNEFDIDTEDLIDIIDEYAGYDYAEIAGVYESPEEIGREELENCYDFPNFLYYYIDLEGFGNSIIDESNRYYRLNNDEIAYISL